VEKNKNKITKDSVEETQNISSSKEAPEVQKYA
jgi:hypothetical protein